MSDGENATPGHGDVPDESGDGRPSRALPSSARAPWERGNAGGSHSEGIPVAELIARVTGGQRVPSTSRRRVDVTPPAEDATEPIPVVDEIPDLSALVLDRQPSAAEADPGPATAHPRRRRLALAVGRALTALVAVAALTATGAAWQWQSAKNKLLNTIAALDPNSSDIRDPKAQIGDENFLIVGVDSRIGANGEMGAGSTSDAAGARSDTIMLVNIPANRKRVVAVSFPRDLAITPMKCQAWDAETGRYGPVYDKASGEWSDNERETTTKLNSAYALGGPKCLVKFIQKLSGLAVNRFMAVDFAGFAKMVDAVGGVEVCSTTPLEDEELGPVLTTAGRQKLDGHTALNYVRARSIASEGNGDYGRIKRQQRFLSSLLRSMISSSTLFDIDRLDAVVNTFIDDSYVDNVQTRDLVRLGQSLQGINAGRITFMTIPTTGVTDSDGNEVPDTKKIRALFDAVIDDKPLPGENDLNETISPQTTPTQTSLESETATPSTDSTTATGSDNPTATPTPSTEKVKAVAADPRDVAVRVAGDQDSLIESATSDFKKYGFDVRKPDYSGDWSTVSTTTVYYSLGNEQAAATIAATLPGAQIKRITGLGDLVQVVLGPEFTTAKYPQASGTALTINVIRSGTDSPTRLPADLTVTNGADISCE